MGVLYDPVAQAISRHTLPVLVVSGDCTTSLGIIAGLQRAGRDPGIVWIDAHGDFDTEATSPSGYLGGLALALAALAYAVLAISTVFDLISLRQSAGQMSNRARRRNGSLLSESRATSDPA